MKLIVNTLLVDVPGHSPLWHLPPITDLGEHRLAPARLLAELERQQPEVVLMDIEQLERLLGFPGLALCELSHLRHLLFVARTPGHAALAKRAATQFACTVSGYTYLDDQWQALDSLQTEHEHSCQRALAHPAVSAAALDGQVLFVVPHPCMPTLADDHLDVTAAAMNQLMVDQQLAQAVHLDQQLAHAALLCMLHGLDRCGLLPAPLENVAAHLANAGIAPGQRALVTRWLDVLQAQGLLRRDGVQLYPTVAADTWSLDALEQAWADLAPAWANTTGGHGTIDYARDNARALPALMRGERAAVHVLFPEGRTERAAALYRESLAAQYQHQAVAHWVAAWAARQGHGAPLRVLEVGAGTGATTQAVLPALAKAGVELDYLCTDVSRYFAEQAVARHAHWPWVRHGVFDIDRPALEQGRTTQTWDLIVAGGVLNAARDTDRTLATLYTLLKPGGWLVFSEPTREEFWVMASQAFMLEQAADERQQTSSTFLDLAQWQAALARTGFQGNRSLPVAGHPLAALGHRVFVAQVPLQRLSRETLAEHLQAPGLRIELPEYLPEPSTLSQWASLSAAKDLP
ncbi:class I SAM-dependent methyltransferase [Pseudomonas putida]|uniref:class I SAM-dependent methyltransferase n=1 Tax=Pseudomonas putida TaxID=303 RepID=UPI001E5F5ED4|nr:class I SAM-dependent methyltransferase [Pseudomonas putida]